MRRIGAAAVCAALLVIATGGGAAASTHRQIDRPHAVTGELVKSGADGRERDLLCPDGEHVLGGGYTLSTTPGYHFGEEAADVITSRPSADAGGWVVEVRKLQRPNGPGEAIPADLTLRIVCAQGETSPMD
jgi:hypothetical protein